MSANKYIFSVTEIMQMRAILSRYPKGGNIRPAEVTTLLKYLDMIEKNIDTNHKNNSKPVQETGKTKITMASNKPRSLKIEDIEKAEREWEKKMYEWRKKYGLDG